MILRNTILSTYRRQLGLLLVLCIATLTASAQAWLTESPKYEVRAVWLTTIKGLDWPHSYSDGSTASIQKQQRELTDILDRLQAVGINTVLLQTRVRATTLYPSKLEPWDNILTGKPNGNPGYDALQFAIDECHRRGMQLHAWVVTILVGKWNSAGCTNLRKQHPKLLKKIGDEGFLDPENSQTATYLADVCAEIVSRYDVDGIHLDYLRYPDGWKIRVNKQQGRRNITAIAEAISRRVKAIKPWVMMSCSPVGKYDDLSRYSSKGWNARTAVCQDAQEWLRTGTMDALFPMMYFRDNNFYPFALDWKEQSHGKIVVPGLGTYQVDRHEANWPLTTLTQEMEVVRSLGLGHCHFRSKFLTDNTKGIYDFERRFNPYPTLIPPMTWRHSEAPQPPTELKITQLEGNLTTLSWNPPTQSKDLSTFPQESKNVSTLYNVYASRECPVDITDARNLVATRLSDCTLTLSRGFYFAVTALDRYGNESAALQSHKDESKNKKVKSNQPEIGLLACNGQRLQLPQKPSTLDAGMVCIETLQGRLVATLPYKGKEINVSQIPEGFYQLRSLNRKGITHRLGFFMVKRRRPTGI